MKRERRKRKGSNKGDRKSSLTVRDIKKSRGVSWKNAWENLGGTAEQVGGQSLL